MQKRGMSEQIDWILGVGMFLLALGFIFVLFKPGITPLNSANTLLDTVQNKFFENVNWEVNKVPIFIEPIKYCTLDAISGKCTSISELGDTTDATILLGGTLRNPQDTSPANRIIYDKLKDLEHRNMEVFFVKNLEEDSGATPSGEPGTASSYSTSSDSTDYKLIFNDVRDADIRTEFPKLVNDADNSVSFNWDKTLNELYVVANLVGKDINGKYIKTKDVLIYNSEKINNVITPQVLNLGDALPNPVKFNEAQTVIACITSDAEGYRDSSTPSTGEWKLNVLEDNAVKSLNNYCRARYELGVVEKLDGISVVKLSKLNNPALDGLKSSWGFPKERSFRITVSGTDLGSNTFNTKVDGTDKYTGLIFPKGVNPPLNVNVFARRFNSFILNDDGVLIPVTVTMQVW